MSYFSQFKVTCNNCNTKACYNVVSKLVESKETLENNKIVALNIIENNKKRKYLEESKKVSDLFHLNRQIALNAKKKKEIEKTQFQLQQKKESEENLSGISKKKNKYKCDYVNCSFQFTNNQLLWKHKVETHFYKCPFCTFWLTSPDKFTSHCLHSHPHLQDPTVVKMQ